MPTLNTQTFGQMVRTYAAAAQSAASQAITFAVGSVELALGEAQATVAQWLQSLIITLLSAIRLSTSHGTDVDSFVGDFGLTRNPATAATGTLTFSRFTSTNVATISPGVQVQTADGTQQFAVIADPGQALWNPLLNVYQIQAGQSSGNVTAQALVAGTGGNVAANTISTILTPISGVDQVTNPAPFENGAPTETDASLKQRFQMYIQSLRQGTMIAVEAAILATDPTLQYVIVEDEQFDGTPQAGYFYVVINDGSGNPPPTTVAAVQAAVAQVRPIGIPFGVFAPNPINVTIDLTLSVASGYVIGAVQQQVQQAIIAYVDAVDFGATLAWSKIFAVAYNVPGVTDVTGLTINGGTSDLTSAINQSFVVKAVNVA